MDCIDSDTVRENVPYMKQALDELEIIASLHPEWIDTGQAARNLYEIFAASEKLDHLYDYRIYRWYAIPLEGNPKYRQIYTLEDMGIDLAKLGTIHYGADYRVLPLAQDPALSP